MNIHTQTYTHKHTHANTPPPCLAPRRTDAAWTQVLDAATGVTLVDDPAANKYPMPLTATGKYDVEVKKAVWGLLIFTSFSALLPQVLEVWQSW